jgi:putative ABC transport system permease protein
VADRVAEIPGVKVVSPLGFGSVGLQYPDGKTATHFVTALDPVSAEAVFTPRLASREQNGTFELHDLTDDGVVVDRHVADQHHIERGDQITFIGPSGATRALTVQGVGDDRNLLGIVTITRTAFQQISPQVVDIQVAGTIDDPSPAHLRRVIADVSDELSDLPSIDVLDRDGFVGSIVDQITGYIKLIQIMLVLSVITALFGIANTLSLSINERVRELGLLRAVGMDRSSVRASVRWEAFLIALLGAVVGLSMGMVLAVALTKAMQSYGLSSFAFPGGWLGLIGMVTTALGTAASIRPARRAAGLSILDAIASE